MKSINDFLVYILDDEPDILELIDTAFMNKGFNVATFKTIPELKAALELFVPNVLVLDLVLGNDNSISFIKETKEKYPDIDLYVISGYLNNDFRYQLNNLNITNIKSKPFEMSEYVSEMYKRYFV